MDSDWLCWEHGAVRRVRRVDWHIRCKQCQFARHGLGQVGARTLATKHHMSKRHQMRVWCVSAGKITTDWSTDDNQLSFDDIPPF
jgi:hypothetical protein